MFAEERHKLIANGLAARMRMTTGELQDLVRASSATVQRDLRILEKQGRIVRVRGGIVHSSYLEGEPTFDQKSLEAIDAKVVIAARVSELISPGSSVFVDSGTTCLEVGRRLLLRKDLTIFTNSVPLTALGAKNNTRLICVGGEIREVSWALVGALTLSWLANLHFDYAVIGASGITAENGAATTELSEAAVKQQLLQRAKTRILAADIGKWEAPQRVTFARWEDFQFWVTDGAIPTSAVERIRAKGCTVEVARKTPRP